MEMERLEALRALIGSRRSIATILALAAAMAVLGIGISFSSSLGVSQVAANATALHWIDVALGSAGVGRASVAQAVFFAFDEQIGVSSAEATAAALNEASASLESLGRVLESPERSGDPKLIQDIQSVVASGEAVIAEADGGDPRLAERLRLDQFEPAFAQLEEGLIAEQSHLANLIAASKAAAGPIAGLTQLAITFIIPALTMFVFWLLMQRRARVREIDLRDGIEAEKKLIPAQDEPAADLSKELPASLTTMRALPDAPPDQRNQQFDLAETPAIKATSEDGPRVTNDSTSAVRSEGDSLTCRFEEVALRSLVEHVLTPYRGSGRDITTRIPAMEVVANPLHLRHVLDSLIANAVKQSGHRVVVAARATDTEVMLVVGDDGPAFPPAPDKNLSTRFSHQGDPSLSASNVVLGLSDAGELATVMGGSLNHSRIGTWNTFTLTLPGPQAARTIAEPMLEMATT